MRISGAQFSEPTYTISAVNWQQDSENRVSNVRYPAWTLLYGIDGRFTNTLRRFRGFRRLDFDIREYSNSSHISKVLQQGASNLAAPMLNAMSGLGVAPVHGAAEYFVGRRGPHDWNGLPSTIPATIRALTVAQYTPAAPDEQPGRLNGYLYGFEGITLDRPGKAPAVGFLIHSEAPRSPESWCDEPPPNPEFFLTVGNNNLRMAKVMLRELGSTRLDSLYQVVILGPQNIHQGSLAKIRTLDDFPVLGGSLLDQNPKGAARLGVASIGRLLIVSRDDRPPYDIQDTTGSRVSDTRTLIFWSPEYVWPMDLRFVHHYFTQGGQPHIPSAMHRWSGERFLVCKQAGTKNWAWPGDSSFTPPDSPPDKSFFILGDSAAPALHRPGARLKVRVRWVNKTTGFVGPMSSPLPITLHPSAGYFQRVRWFPSVVDMTLPTSPGKTLLRAVFGVDMVPVSIRSSSIESVMLTGEWYIQFWCTTSSNPGNPSWGGGGYFLDHEIQIKGIVNDTGSLVMIPNQHSIWEGVPQKSNEELLLSEYYDPAYDNPLPIEGSRALGVMDGMLLSLSRAESTGVTADLGYEDIRVSPPWRFDPDGWLEAASPRALHRVRPKAYAPPRFVSVGDMAYHVNSNTITRIERVGSSVRFVRGYTGTGAASPEAVTSARSTMFMVTGTGLVEVSAQSGGVATINLVRQIITRKWAQAVRDGDIISGYDPQLNAVFICPTRSRSSNEWKRSEALVLWLDTGRITMLKDIYWVGMTRSLHPITGREHLFFIDPAYNITYADDSLYADATIPSTMTGINRFVYPNLKRVRPTLSFTVNDWSAVAAQGQDAIIWLDHCPLRGELDWIASVGNDETAESITEAINRFSVTVGCGILSASRAGNVITVTSRLYGAEGSLIPLWFSWNIVGSRSIGITQMGANWISLTTDWTAGEVFEDHSNEKWGGVTRGTITGITGTTTLTVKDIACHVNGKGTFDQYSWYNPYGPLEADTYKRHGALIGSQVYFFRTVNDPEGIPRTRLVASCRIADNTANTFTLQSAEIEYMPGFSSLQVGDAYSIAPVVVDLVSAPIDPQAGPGSTMLHTQSINMVGHVATFLRGFLQEGSEQYPPSGIQNDVLLGISTVQEIEAARFDTPNPPGTTLPAVSQFVKLSQESQHGWAYIPRHGQGLCLVLQHYGTFADFELTQLHARLTSDGETIP